MILSPGETDDALHEPVGRVLRRRAKAHGCGAEDDRVRSLRQVAGAERVREPVSGDVVARLQSRQHRGAADLEGLDGARAQDHCAGHGPRHDRGEAQGFAPAHASQHRGGGDLEGSPRLASTDAVAGFDGSAQIREERADLRSAGGSRAPPPAGPQALVEEGVLLPLPEAFAIALLRHQARREGGCIPPSGDAKAPLAHDPREQDEQAHDEVEAMAMADGVHDPLQARAPRGDQVAERHPGEQRRDDAEPEGAHHPLRGRLPRRATERREVGGHFSRLHWV